MLNYNFLPTDIDDFLDDDLYNKYEHLTCRDEYDRLPDDYPDNYPDMF